MENETLLIFCTDSVAVQDKVTFSSYLLDGIRVTHWLEEAENTDEKIARMFDILFEETAKNKNKKLVEKNHTT